MTHIGQMIDKGGGLRGQAIIAAIGFVQKVANLKGTGQTIAHGSQIAWAATTDGQT
jgi:hypothetical protein